MAHARRFEVLEVLGQGGFGAVYRARVLGEGQFSKEVALKVLHEGLTEEEELTQRLRDEARLLGLLRHRAIIRTDGLILLDGRWTVLMEYVEGVDLSRLLGGGPLPPKVALELIAEVASALHAAWNTLGPEGQPLRLMHRDIKPSNIQLTAYGEVKLLDFGIARAEFAAREAETRSIHFGSPAYMSPERLDFEDSDTADVYALGVVLFELLMGENFGKTSAVLSRHEQVVAPALERLATRDDLDPGLSALLERMLAWDPAARPGRREVERAATQLASECAGEPLRFWAEAAVTRAAIQRGGPPPTSTILTEGPGGAAPAPPPPAQRRPGLLLFVGVLSLLVSALALTGGWLRQAPSEAPTASGAPEEEAAASALPKPSALELPAEPAEPEPEVRQPERRWTPPAEEVEPEGMAHTMHLGAGTEGVTAIELVCPSGYRVRAPKVDGRATFTGVPSETCDAFTKGAPPAKGQIHGDTDSSRCSITGTTLVCKSGGSG